jgi:hypothetical protein
MRQLHEDALGHTANHHDYEKDGHFYLRGVQPKQDRSEQPEVDVAGKK